MAVPRIKVFLKPYCPWSPGVRAVLERRGLAYEVANVVDDSAALAEMVRHTGQASAPCVEIDGEWLVDVGGDEVEAWLDEHGLTGEAAKD
jgi:monothiol glutaredoxin